MADLGITGLKNEVDVQIYTNHAQAITGAIMNDTLIDTIDTLKNGGNLDEKSVDTAQLADNAVEALQLNTDAVETAKIKNLNVTTSKLAAKAVTREKLADDAMASIAPEWVANTPYAWYDFVMRNNLLYMCISPNSDATWIGDHWLVKDVGKVLTSHYHDNGDISSLLSDIAVALDTTVDNFAFPWISNHSYVVGEFVIREYKLYRCKTANNDSVWTASKWVQTSIEEEISSVEILAEKNSQDLLAINVDNLGDVRAKSIDMDELPKVCSFPMYIISETAPDVVPDFVSQHWIDTIAKKVYIAVGVSSAADFVALN